MCHFLKYWLPLLIWLAVIFVNSTDLMSAEHTSRFIVPILLWLKPGMAPETIQSILFPVRKYRCCLAQFCWVAPLLLRATNFTNHLLNRARPQFVTSSWILQERSSG